MSGEKQTATLKPNFWNSPINGTQMKVFLPVSVVVWVIAFLGKLPKDVFATYIFLWSLGLFLSFLGKKIPFLGKYAGFGPILALFGSSLLVTFGLVGEELKEQCSTFINTAIIPVLVGLLLAGSILGGMDRQTLKKAALRYIPVILIGQVCAIGGAFLFGKILGYDLFHSVVLTAFPCFSGGSSGALGIVPTAISQALGIDANEFVGYMMAALTLANIEAILLSAALNLLGKAKPALTGNGNLLRNKDKSLDVSEDSAKPFDGNFMNLLRCLLIIGTLVILGNVLSNLIKPVIDLNSLVYTIILCMIVKLLGILPKDWEASMSHWFAFAVPLFIPTLITGIGIGSIDVVSTFASITPSFFLLVTATVLCFVIGSMLGGALVGFYPVESGISVGCCSCNIGGTGDLICCETANRMSLYPFATLSTRLAGSITLLELGFILNFVNL